MYGTKRSFTCHLVNNPKINKPNKGPYVQDAITYKASMTLLLFKRRKIRMQRMKTTEIKKCTFLRCFSALSFGSFVFSRISTQKLVVKAVKAESALEKAAAIIPIVKHIKTGKPKQPLAAKNGRMSSPPYGIVNPIFGPNNSNRIPKERNSRLTGTNDMPYQYIFF